MVLWFQCEMSAVGNTHTHKHKTSCKYDGQEPNDDNTKSTDSFIINVLLEENIYGFFLVNTAVFCLALHYSFNKPEDI